MDKNKDFDHAITKIMIENIVKSANLSDPATKKIFTPFFLYIPDLSGNEDEIIEIWL